MVERLVGRPLHYAWLIVLVTFVTLITTAGFRATPGVLIVPLQREFGWSRGAISLAVSIGLLLFGLTAPFSAALMERFGMRRVMLIALLTIATGASLLALMGVFDIVGTTTSGWLTDRLDPRHLLAWYHALRGLAVSA